MKKSILILLFFSFILSGARASLLIDPYFGMVFNGKADSSGAESDYSGTSYGARIGYQNLGLFLGLDYRMAAYKMDGDFDFDLDSTTYAAFIGYEFPVMIRVWGEYVIGGEGSADNVDYSGASGTILGVGYTGLPLVSLNLEMANWKYDTYKAGSIEGDTDLGGSHILLSVSLPLTF